MGKNDFLHTKAISLTMQKIQLLKTYPELIDGEITISGNVLTCIMHLQPSPESIVYRVKITKKTGKFPQARIIDPKEIARFNGRKPHHLYDRSIDGQERLCVFSPKDEEWNEGMFIADAFIPWIVTWLSAYEYWQITGEWVYPERLVKKE